MYFIRCQLCRGKIINCVFSERFLDTAVEKIDCSFRALAVDYRHDVSHNTIFLAPIQQSLQLLFRVSNRFYGCTLLAWMLWDIIAAYLQYDHFVQLQDFNVPSPARSVHSWDSKELNELALTWHPLYMRIRKEKYFWSHYWNKEKIEHKLTPKSILYPWYPGLSGPTSTRGGVPSLHLVVSPDTRGWVVPDLPLVRYVEKLVWARNNSIEKSTKDEKLVLFSYITNIKYYLFLNLLGLWHSYLGPQPIWTSPWQDWKSLFMKLHKSIFWARNLTTC